MVLSVSSPPRFDREHVAQRIVGRLQRHVGQHRLETAIALGDGLKMFEVALALRIVVRIALAHQRQIVVERPRDLLGGTRPCRRALARAVAPSAAKAVRGRRLRAIETATRPRIERLARARARRRSPRSGARRVRWPTPCTSISARNHETASAGLATTRRCASTSLMCAVSMNLKPPRLMNGMSRRCSSSSRSKEWKLERNSTAISLSSTPSSRSSRMRCGDEARLHVLVLRAHQQRAELALALGEQHLGVFLGGARNDLVGDVEDALQSSGNSLRA